MGYPDDLLEQALHLANRERRRPRQASLRRAISAAYYALFHLLIEEATRNWRNPQQRVTLGRCFEHGAMKNACGEYSVLANRMGNDELRLVAATFVKMHQERQKADYDSTVQWTRTDTLSRIETVGHAFQSWRGIRDQLIAQDFLPALLVKRR